MRRTKRKPPRRRRDLAATIDRKEGQYRLLVVAFILVGLLNVAVSLWR